VSPSWFSSILHLLNPPPGSSVIAGYQGSGVSALRSWLSLMSG